MQKQIQQIQKEVDSFLSLEDSFKGKGAEAIRSFYQESHVPFLLLMEGFIRDYEDTLGHIQKSLQSLDSDKRAFIQQSFLQNELQSGIRDAKNVTMGITNDANSSIRSVRDIVHLPAIDDDAFLHQVDQANKKTNQTIEKLHMFDKQSTSRLGTAENDLQFMKDYIHKIRGMIKGGKLNIATYSPRELKDLDVHQDMIRRLSKKAATNAFSLDTLLAIGGHSLLSRYVPLSDVIVTYLQKKFKMRTMDYSMRAVQGIIDANSITISQEEFSILQGQVVEEVTISDYQKVWHGSYLTLRDGRKVREYKDDNGNMRYRFVTEIPENRLKPEEKNAFQKTGESLQEIGADIWNGLVTRKEKAWNSWYDFGNYITLGSFDIGKNMYSGLQYNAENMLNTPSDFFNWLTIGGVDLVKGVVTPEEQFSKEHLLASFGLATVFIGGVRTPNSLTGTVNKLPNSSPPKVKRTSLSTRIKSSQKLAILTNIREWYRVNVPEIGLVYDSIGGYHLIVKKAEGRSGGGSRGSGKGTGLESRKLSSEQIKLDWLADKYTAVEVKGTVKVGGKEVDVSRRVYQIEIDKNYVPNNPKALGKSNEELMKKGKSPYVVKDGVESKVELHHLIQKEPGGMVEIAELIHDKYDSALHGLVESGKSFRNNPELEKMYNNFRSNYWKMRAIE